MSIETKLNGDIWTAWDDHFVTKFGNPPVGYGVTKEKALGALTKVLTETKVKPK